MTSPRIRTTISVGISLIKQSWRRRRSSSLLKISSNSRSKEDLFLEIDLQSHPVKTGGVFGRVKNHLSIKLSVSCMKSPNAFFKILSAIASVISSRGLKIVVDG